MLPTASCTPPILLWYHPQAIPPKKRNGHHHSEPGRKSLEVSQAGCCCCCCCCCCFLRFLFFLGSGATTDTHIFDERKWCEQSPGEGGLVASMIRREKKILKNGWVLLCLICCDLPYFFWMWKVMPKSRPKERMDDKVHNAKKRGAHR